MDLEDRVYTDPSQNFIERPLHPLDPFFHPNSIAVIGAKDDKGAVGATVMQNLLSGGYQGKIYPVNPKRKEVFGLKTYPNLAAILEPVDLIIVITPAATVPALIEEATLAKVKAAIVISAGFKELGEVGLKLEKELLEKAKKGNIRIIGPNCLGLMNPLTGLNATFARGIGLKGNIAFISQSGAMCTAVLDWSFKAKVGFSAFVSIGSMADVNWADLIDYLGSDPNTRSILIYMETIGDARSFLSVAREIALEKPIIVIKPGRSKEAEAAAASHTGSLAGSDDVFEAAMERCGVLRVDTIEELFNMASCLAKQPLPKGPSLAIITNAGGPSVLATDATILDGAKLAILNKATIEKLNPILPNAWSHANPVDILGDATADRYAKTVQILGHDKNSDGLLVILSPQDMTDPIETAKSLEPFAKNKDKPLIASWMGGKSVDKGVEILNELKIPNFAYPDSAASSFATMWKYSQNLLDLYQTPLSHTEKKEEEIQQESIRIKKAKELIDKVRKENRTLLTEYESKELLSIYKIPTVKTVIAKTEVEAIEQANKLNYPVVVKLLSETITHKSDVGGVKLNLKSSEDVRLAFNDIKKNVLKNFKPEDFQGVTVQEMIQLKGYELILGSSVDAQFGPVLLFGAGGILVEIFKDSALGLPPLNRALAKKMMQKTKIYQALQGVRGQSSIDNAYLEFILVQFSLMIVENPWIKECDINPLLASSDKIVALDARVVLQDLDSKEFPKLAIRPYPYQYITHKKMKNGQDYMIRPIAGEDETAVITFHKELSENSVRQRFFEFVSLDARIAHERLVRICFNDFDRDMAVVAENEGVILGIGRLSRNQKVANLTLIISDPYHGQGVGIEMVKHLIHIAKSEKLKEVQATILDENFGMLKICEKLGFSIKRLPNNKLVTATLTL